VSAAAVAGAAPLQSLSVPESKLVASATAACRTLADPFDPGAAAVGAINDLYVRLPSCHTLTIRRGGRNSYGRDRAPGDPELGCRFVLLTPRSKFCTPILSITR